MEPNNFNDYWTYFISNFDSPGFLLSFFKCPEYDKYLIIHTNYPIEYFLDIPDNMSKYISKLNIESEFSFLVKYFTDEEREVYYNILQENNISILNHYIYKIEFNKNNIEDLFNFLIPNKFKGAIKMNKNIDYRSYSNEDENILYIILRNDLGLTSSEQLVYSSQMAIKMAIKMNTYIDYNNFFRLFDNIVILQASKKDLFEDNFIPIKYDNPNIVFDYHTNEEIRVAHNNFKLDESKIVALGYYGIKKDMPKWIKKLQLYK